jgi:N4-gp56 family major capsid protein
MSDTILASANSVTAWSDKFFTEYVRASQFQKLMGTDENSALQLIEDLTKQVGDKVTVSLITRLVNAGVTGNNTLEGNEEMLGNYGHQLTIDQLRNAVVVGNMQQIKSKIDLLNASRAALKNWSVDQMRTGIINALYSPVVDGKTKYADATEAQKDAWLAANSDRVLFGAAKANNAGNDHSVCTATVDGSADVLAYGIVSLAKRMAKVASPHIRPIKVDEKGEWYVLLCNSYCFRDLKTSLATIQSYAAVRGDDNPLFVDGDIMWDGVICKEIPEIGVISNAGASGTTDIAANFLVGAQAVGIGWGQRTQFTTKTFDYGAKSGVALSEIRGIEKLMFNSKQNGVFTIYCAAVADT